MPKGLRLLTSLVIATLLPTLALQAQPQAPPAPPSQPTAKDVVKAVEKEEKASEKKETPDAIERIKEEGLKHSQVMATLSYLTDVIGPRLTGSPQMRRANEWSKERLASWGLQNAHLEPWGTFGRGWSLKRFSAQVIEPQCVPLIAYPKAWSPGIDGTLVAPVVYLGAKTEADLAKFKGKLKGAIVLTSPARDMAARFEPMASRLTEKELLTLADAPEPAPRGAGGRRGRNGENAGAATKGAPNPRPAPPLSDRAQRLQLARKTLQFLVEEGAAVLVDPSRQGDGGTLYVSAAMVPGSPTGPGGKRIAVYDKDAPKATIPQVVVADEHYNRMVRMIEQGEPLKVAIDLSVAFHDDDLSAYNTIAEIPGTDLKDQVVMLGGHMDSWHSGTGATDNAAGVAVAMEAVRILKALDLKPRRTVRIALWSGEEQGIFGSRGYVMEHFGKAPPQRLMDEPRPPSSEGESIPKESADSTREHEYDMFSAYYNLDNGTGKIRGVYLQGNEAVRPLFRKWLQPFRDMGAATLTIANTGSTDHESFDGIGLPGFQFIQDSVEYGTRTHHSNQDVYDRIQADDVKQAAVIIAAFVYNTAMLDEKLPRKPKPGAK